VTDPYQPLEKRYRITRGCLEVLLPAGFTPVILTRARRVLDDLELLRAHRNVAVGISLPTDDDDVRRAFEPGADPIPERLDALRTLRAAGVRTFAVVQPMLPMDPARLVAEVAPHVDAVRLDRMHELSGALPLYERAGLRDAATDAFAEEHLRRLTDGFSAAGVAIDVEDDLASLVLDALTPSS
jgi:DNA repair photolyase